MVPGQHVPSYAQTGKIFLKRNYINRKMEESFAFLHVIFRNIIEFSIALDIS
jgi:hypothetical protein